MPTARRADTGTDAIELLKADHKEVKAIFGEFNAIERDGEDDENAVLDLEHTPSQGKKVTKPAHDVELIAQAERLLNRVLGYQAAIAVHQLKDELGLDVEELTLSVVPFTSETVGAYRVVCTIVRASVPAPLVVEVIVGPERVGAGNGKNPAV